MTHTCTTCGKIADNTGHLCDPTEVTEAYVCEHCGSSHTDPRHICKPKLQNINFTCITCGRVAELPKQLCNPRDIVLLDKTSRHKKSFNIKRQYRFRYCLLLFL